MDGAGIVSADYRLRSIRQADARSGRRAIILALAVALLFHMRVLLSAVDSSVREAEMKLLRMKEIIQDYEKQHHDMMNNLATMLSKNARDIESLTYNRATSTDGTENPRLIVSMKDADVYEPSNENVQMGEIVEEAPKVNQNHEAAPVGGSTASPSQAEAMGAHKEKPWLVFLIPSDHIFVLDCLDDELMVRILPPSDNESMLAGVGCSRRQQQAGMVPFMYTLFMAPPGKERVEPHYTLFMSPPGKERVVPVPSPRALKWEELSIEEVTDMVPESFTLSPNVVIFYYREKGGNTAMLIAPTDSVEHLELAEEEPDSMVTALTPPGILPTSFPCYA